MDKSKFSLPSKYEECEENDWVEFSNLVRKYKPVNLGQGAPDFSAPKILTDALEQVAKTRTASNHQYCRGMGHLPLVEILAKFYSRLLKRELDPLNEILITVGASQALYYSILGFIDKGDEVIIIEPYFDLYSTFVLIAGGTPRYIQLRFKHEATSSQEWILDKNELENIFTTKTKMLILNTPNNPIGKVFTMDELEMIADLCKRWNVVCLADEVYEWTVFEPYTHHRIATLPGMWERTITICSAGKTFGATGWRIGWAYGPPHLIYNLQIVHANCIYTCDTPLQEALAQVYEKEIVSVQEENSYFRTVTKSFERKRNFVVNLLKEIGLKPIIPSGGYFILFNWTPLESYANFESEIDKYRDCKFMKWMIKKIGLELGIPGSFFYSEQNKEIGENFIRICFIKEDETLQKAANILKEWIRSKK